MLASRVGWTVHRVCWSCPLDNCPIMLHASLLANAEILPQARQGSYFFNRIGQKQSIGGLVGATSSEAFMSIFLFFSTPPIVALLAISQRNDHEYPIRYSRRPHR
ncbi:hypothetical protein PS712_03385 [Pseudomonas fluorescens]|uniref:Uncharacterized protein n=1 Tax=Pseudomonas fluorescens TaxID=294 RepID=A0A5E7CYF7_PSEFL|nr:hypothetical protein PS712_03385 [Pseudomonas fluorescens]